MLERTTGRLMRGPEGHEPATPPVPTPDPSLLNEPPVDPNTPPVDPNAPPVDPNAPLADPKPADPPPVVEPLTVDKLTLPEGLEFPEGVADKLVEIFNGDQSPEERANALLALHGETMRNALEADSKAWDNMQTEWKDAAKADPDVGGAKLQPALTNIGNLLNEFGDKDVREVFDITGAGNNVHMIKFLDKIASVLTEGKFFKAGSPGATNDPDAAAKRMFPSASN